MRTRRDRVRHCILYEVILLALITPLGSALLHQQPEKIGALGIGLSLNAMVWNYLFNLGFDKSLRALKRPLYPRGLMMRTLHALLFEGGLVFVTIPAMMWWLNIDFWQALMLDLGFLLLVPLYTLLYNWSYDQIFPVALHQPSPPSTSA